MTIASCLVLPEGVIFGVDSTTSTSLETGMHYLNHNQKLFEVGEDSSLAIMTWGLSGFKDVSYRTLIANLADGFEQNGQSYPNSVQDAASEWASLVWSSYNKQFEQDIERVRQLEAKQAVSAANASDERSEEEDDEYKALLSDLKVGFCLGGHCSKERTPEAYWFEMLPTQRSPSIVRKVDREGFFGQPDLFLRLYDGFDFNIRRAILESPFWKGEGDDLDRLLDRQLLAPPPHMTIRDGIDFVHFSIYSTIKALKFSANDQICGGPIELAVITTDRKFRWVKHKTWDSAIGYDGA